MTDRGSTTGLVRFWDPWDKIPNLFVRWHVRYKYPMHPIFICLTETNRQTQAVMEMILVTYRRVNSYIAIYSI